MKKLTASQLATTPIVDRVEVGLSPMIEGTVQTVAAAGMKFSVLASLSLPDP